LLPGLFLKSVGICLLAFGLYDTGYDTGGHRLVVVCDPKDTETIKELAESMKLQWTE